MTRRHRYLLAPLLGSLVFCIAPPADAREGLGLGIKGGTLGAGVELSASLLENTRLRGGFNYLQFSFDSTIAEIDYEFEPEFNSISLLLDWHPFGGAFFLSGGAYINNNTVAVDGSLDEGLVPPELTDFAYLTDLVSVSGEVEFAPIAPYVGLGWRTNNGEPGWGLSCDLGVMFQGAPDVTNLRVNAPVDVNGLPEVQDFLAEQEDEIEDELSLFQYYPVASVMLLYNF